MAKYSAGGTLLWVEDFAGNVNAIAVDGNGVPFINLGDATIEKLDPATGNSFGQCHGWRRSAERALPQHRGTQWLRVRPMGQQDHQVHHGPGPRVEHGAHQTLRRRIPRISVDGAGNVWATFYAVFGTVSLGGTDCTSFRGYIYNLSGGNGDVLACTSPGAFKFKKVFNTGSGDWLVQGDFAFNQPNVVKYDGTQTAVWSAPTSMRRTST